MKTLLLGLGAILVIWYWFHRRGNPEFWKYVRYRPDFAFPWFQSEDCWVIAEPGQPSPSSDAYTIGFPVVNPATGRIVKVHCLRNHIESSQKRFLEAFDEHRAREDRQSPLSEKLAQLAVDLGGKSMPPDVAKRLEAIAGPAQPLDRSAAIARLLDFVEAQPFGRKVMAKHAADRQTIAACFAALETNGAGVWVGDHYVPVSATAQVILLDDVLAAAARPAEWPTFCHGLVAYFQAQGSQLAWFGD